MIGSFFKKGSKIGLSTGLIFKCEILRMSVTTRMVMMIIIVVKINCVLLAKICCREKG